VKKAADVARLPLINDLARQGWHDWFRAAGVHGAELAPAHVFSDTTDAFEAAALGLGAALAREQIVRPWLEAGRQSHRRGWSPGPRGFPSSRSAGHWRARPRASLSNKDGLRGPENFSLVLGGPLFQLLCRAHLSDDALLLLCRRILARARRRHELCCWAAASEARKPAAVS